MLLVQTCFLLLLVLKTSSGSRLYESHTTTPIKSENVDATTLKTGTNLSDPSEIEEENSPTEFSSGSLEELIMKNYNVEKPRTRYFGNNRWDFKQPQKSNYPFDEKKGWVSLEPVPWSVSKISKWHSRYKPQENTNFDFNIKKPYKQRPPPNTYHYQQNYNDFPTDEDDFNVDNRNSYYDSRPISRPVISSFAQKLHIKNTISDSDYSSDIITDGMPADFPEHHQSDPYNSYSNNYNRRQSLTTESGLRPSSAATHPFSGDGEWVLLSTTKGYKYPKPKSRERSLNLEADNSIGVHRSVRLTVLPPLKGSKVNMTTSHGGLLQVDASFQTVEQAAQKYKRQKQKPKPVKQRISTTTTRRPRTMKPFPVKRKEAPATTVTTRNNAPDTSAVLAAVGAGMIPATMAMLLPMAMGGRRKKRQARSVTGRPSVFEITLPRSL